MDSIYQTTEQITICLVGLPSSGKSSFVNSLCGKRLCQTGVARTTEKPVKFGSNYVNSENSVNIELKSNDKYSFSLIDLPGISDSQDIKKKFDDIAFDTACDCDIIIWMTDSDTAFVQTHEKQYFDNFYDRITNHCNEFGKYKKFMIILSKYESDDKPRNLKSNPNRKNHEEIIDDFEDSNKIDIYNNVLKLYKDKAYIIKFSSFSRIIHNNASTDALKKIVLKNSINPPNLNNTFNLKWFMNNLHPNKNESLYNSIVMHIDNLCKSFKDLDIEKSNIVKPDLNEYVMEYNCLKCDTKLNDQLYCTKCTKNYGYKYACNHFLGQGGSITSLNIHYCQCCNQNYKFIMKCKKNCNVNGHINIKDKKIKDLKCPCGSELEFNKDINMCKYCGNLNATKCCGKDDWRITSIHELFPKTYKTYLKDIEDYEKNKQKQLESKCKQISSLMNNITYIPIITKLVEFLLQYKDGTINNIIRNLVLNDSIIQSINTILTNDKNLREKIYEYKENKAERFIVLTSKSSIHYARYYLSNIGKEENMESPYCKELKTYMPSLAILDTVYYNKPTVIFNKKFREQVYEIRRSLWGDCEDDLLDDNFQYIYDIAVMMRTDEYGDRVIRSLFERIDREF